MDNISRKIAAFMAARRRAWAHVSYARVTFEGGPLAGQSCDLESTNPSFSSTLPIRIRDWVGHYENGAWLGNNGTTANAFMETAAPAVPADFKEKGYSLLLEFMGNLVIPQDGELATFRIQKTMFRVANTPEGISNLRTRILAKKTYFSDKALNFTPFTKEVSMEKFSLPAGNLYALETLIKVPAVEITAPTAPMPDTAKPEKSSVCHGLTKNVGALARRRQRHLAAFQRGELPADTAGKYARLGLLDLANNAITRRGALLLATRFN